MNTFSSLHARLTLHAPLRLNERQAFAGLKIRKDSRPRGDPQHSTHRSQPKCLAVNLICCAVRRCGFEWR